MGLKLLKGFQKSPHTIGLGFFTKNRISVEGSYCLVKGLVLDYVEYFFRIKISYKRCSSTLLGTKRFFVRLLKARNMRFG